MYFASLTGATCAPQHKGKHDDQTNRNKDATEDLRVTHEPDDERHAGAQ